MKKNTSLVATLFCMIGIVMLQACKKNTTKNASNNETGTPSKFSSLNAFAKSFAPPQQVFTVDASTGGTIRGDHGYSFAFAPGSITDELGKPITGNVDLTLVEITNDAEMLAAGAFTEAEDGILGSAGMFNLIASQGGKQVFINPAKPIVATVLTSIEAEVSGLKVFNGIVKRDSSGDTTIRWKRDSVGNSQGNLNWDSVKQVWDSIQKVLVTKRCIRFNLYTCGWCNLDAYWNLSTGAAIRISVGNVDGNTETRVFMHLDQGNLKGLYEMRKDATSGYYQSDPYNLLEGWSIKIIVVTRTKEGVLKYETGDITNTKGAVHEFKTFITTTDDGLEQFFKGL